MTSDQWRQIEELYSQARVLEPSQRAALLSDACRGDDNLRREVESLLAAEQLPISVLDHPVVAKTPAPRLLQGTQLGTYRIDAVVGEGGMGVVYKAHDTKLNRPVAIKLLSDDVADASARLRFEREAQTASSLNHPHILTVYDVGNLDGRQYLVTEFIDHGTLSGWARAEPRSWRQIVDMLVGVADGLAAAHAAGILHRDIKPENILVATSGYAKLADFGLAKLMEGAIAAPAGPLVTRTHSGVITGTIGYMSPEQAEGKVVDARSDIFSFGVVLYELLARRRPFAGETELERLHAIVHETPPPLPETLPVGLRIVVEKALEKDPSERYQSMRELVVDLRRIARAKGEDQPSSTQVPTDVRHVTSAGWVAAAFAGAVVALAILTVVYLRTPPASDAAETRLEITTPITNDPRSFALSPDGRALAYVAEGSGQSQLWVRQLSSTRAQPLTATEGGAAYPFWSPDSRSIGFFSGGKLKRIDASGGAPQTVTDAPSGRGGTWNAEGLMLFTPTPASSVFRVPASGGQAAAVTKLAWAGSHRFPQFLPDGRHYLVYAEGSPQHPGPGLSGSICLGILDSAELKCLTPADTAGLYMPSGWLVWVRDGKLVAGHLDVERETLTGDPITVADSVFFDSSHARLFSVSATGLLAYRQGAPILQFTWFDRSGKLLGALAAPADNSGADKIHYGYVGSNPRISPDGQRVAISRRVQDATDVWLLDQSRANRFTFEGGGNGVWSPDGGRIAFQSQQSDEILAKPSDGTQSQTPLFDFPRAPRADGGLNDWSPDGRFLIYMINTPQTGYDLWVSSLDHRPPRVFLQTKFDERHARFSPDGRWVAYQSNESGRPEIYIRAFAEADVRSDIPAGQWQVSLAGGIFPAWRHDGKELYWIAPDGRLMAAPIAVAGKTLQPGAPTGLFQTRIYGGGLDVNTGGGQFDVAADGRFLINTIVDNAATSITLLQNWKAPAK